MTNDVSARLSRGEKGDVYTQPSMQRGLNEALRRSSRLCASLPGSPLWDPL